MKDNNSIKKTIYAALFAALIFIGISVFRISLPAIVGRPFIHFGNTFAVVAVMTLGFKYGTAAAVIGLGMFDILNGYAATSWITMLEALILGAVTYSVFKIVHYENGEIGKLYIVSFSAGFIKIVTSWMAGVIESLMVGTQIHVAFINSFLSLPSATINSIVTFIVAPLIYIELQRIIFRKYSL